MNMAEANGALLAPGDVSIIHYFFLHIYIKMLSLLMLSKVLGNISKDWSPVATLQLPEMSTVPRHTQDNKLP